MPGQGVVRQELRVGVKAPGAAGLRWFHAAYEGGAICFGTRPPHGVAPGRHTLTLDPGARFAPLVLAEVAIGAGLTELEPVTFELGATVRVQILTGAGSDPPRIYVGARHIGEPDYFRSINSNGEGVVELTGLGPRRFKVSTSRMAWQRRLEREFATDGKSDPWSWTCVDGLVRSDRLHGGLMTVHVTMGEDGLFQGED